MICDEFGLGFDDSRKPVLEHLREASVQLLAPGLEQRLIGGVLDQGVLETVGRVGRAATAKHELGADLRSSPLSHCSCGRSATAAMSSWENSRPITAPIWASSLTVAGRSSRAISESCRFAGITKLTAGARKLVVIASIGQ